jgi:hypothetical protein
MAVILSEKRSSTRCVFPGLFCLFSVQFSRLFTNKRRMYFALLLTIRSKLDRGRFLSLSRSVGSDENTKKRLKTYFFSIT